MIQECERCNTPFEQRLNGHPQRFCSGKCRDAEHQRRRRLSVGMTPRSLDPACVSCGVAVGDWWVGRRKVRPSRCRECETTHARLAAQIKRGRLRIGRTCVDCGGPHPNDGTRSPRCIPCREEAFRSRRNDAELRRWRAVSIGDKRINWRSVGERDHWVCHLCGEVVGQVPGTAHEPRGATVDHLTPIALGGAHTFDNVAMAHRVCNLKRGKSVLEDSSYGG